jgi:sterol desaturase/sphingolipid hydroxylase (fatty acid hydroxylase superfamily)
VTLLLVTAAILALVVLASIVATYAIILGGWGNSLRLQPSPITLARFHRDLPLILFNLAILAGGAAIAFYFLADRFTMLWTSTRVIALDVAFILLMEDGWGYFVHRYLHENRMLYKRIHLLHHKIPAPLPAYFLYIHPLEWMVQSLGAAFGVAILLLIHHPMSAYSVWIAAFLRQAYAADQHSGIRSFLWRRTPIFSPTDLHDDHHLHPNNGNYGGVLVIWDRLFHTAHDVDSKVKSSSA